MAGSVIDYGTEVLEVEKDVEFRELNQLSLSLFKEKVFHVSFRRGMRHYKRKNDIPPSC